MTKHWKAFLIVIVLLAVAGYLAYSLYTVYQTGADKGLVSACRDNPNAECWYGHVHAYVPITICGEDYRLPIQKAPLSGPHTHNEKNMIHWHGDKGLPYDRATQTITDTGPLTLGAFFDAMEVPFKQNQIAEKKNGDRCPDGSVGTLKMFVNGVANTDFQNYVWRDHDVIVLSFDNRSAASIEADLASHPIAFPVLGRE